MPVAYAGGVRKETLRIAADIGIPHVDGGLRDNTPEQATALCREHGVKFNIENHPEKSAAEILGKIGGGNEWLGVCIDMGWLGTQGVDGPGVIKACAPFVRHTHVKDVKAAGQARDLPPRRGLGRRRRLHRARSARPDTPARTRGKTSRRTATRSTRRPATASGSRSRSRPERPTRRRVATVLAGRR